MSTQPVDGPGEAPDLSNLSLSSKEDFLVFAETPPRAQPEQLTRSQVEALNEAAQADRARRLRVWHANLGPFETPQLADLHKDMWDIIDSNEQDGDKAKGAIAIDAFPGLGKSTAVMAFARKYHLREIAEKGRFTPDGHERLPVCRVGLTGNTSMKELNRALLEFYGHSGRREGTSAQMARRALNCAQSCHCRLLIIDDLHFLRWGRTNGIEVSNHFKFIANEFPVTLLMIGVGLEAKGLFSEGDSYTNAPLAQTGRRTTKLDMQAFLVDTDQERREWRQLLLAIERKLVLADKYPGMLADDLSDYLFARSTGHIGSLMTLINRGCQRAVRTGTERLDQELMDKVKRRRGRGSPQGAGTRPGGPQDHHQDHQAAQTVGGVMTPVRTFPIRLAPLPGEALDSWLEALAHRLDVRLGDVLNDLGLAAPFQKGAREQAVPTDWTIALRDDEAARIAYATGVDPQQLHDMTLMHFDGRALRIDHANRQVSRHVLWGRPRGSRFCPECLADSGGRWPLTWRLGWSFACLTHRRLLADWCPACRRVQRERPFSRHAQPFPGRCGVRPSRTGDLDIPAGCGQDLTLAETLILPVGHPALEAQRLILETIESGSASYGPDRGLPASVALADLRAVAGRVLADLPEDDLPKWTPQDLIDAYLRSDHDEDAHHEAQVRPGFMSPARAARAVLAVTAAFRVLGQPDIQQAGAVMRDLVEAIREEFWQVSTTSIDSWGRGIGPVLRGAYLAALGPTLRPSDQLQHRTASSLPAPPATRRAQVNRRVRKVPSSLWPYWAVRLSPPDGAYHRTLAPVLSSAVLLVGNPMELGEVATRLGSVTDDRTISRVLQLLAGNPRWEAIATAVTRLADYLDGHDVPIDYQRRRRLDYSGLLPPQQWLDLCRRTGVPPGQGRRDKMARCLLFTRISGLPVEAAPDFSATGEAYFRAETARFAAIRTPELAAVLDEASRDFLARHRVRGEPVTWHPPASLLSGLDLPGPDPSLIDVTRLHELIRERAHPVKHAAGILGTTVDAVRVVLDEHPGPVAPLSETQARATGQVRHAARHALTEKEFRRRYVDRHQSLYDIAKQTGFSRQTLTRLAAEYGIALREGPQDYKRKGVIGRDWLYEQYVDCGRTLPDLAREKNMSTANMARWAHLHQIPLRPRGGASHDSSLRTVNQAADLPAAIAKALTSPYALERLNRFAAAVGYRTLSEAAEHLGIKQSTLVVQINRLERDIGGSLLERAERGHPMSPTALGEQVLAALSDPTIVMDKNR